MRIAVVMVVGLVLFACGGADTTESQQAAAASSPAAIVGTATPSPTPNPVQTYRTQVESITTRYSEEWSRLRDITATTNFQSQSWRDLAQSAFERVQTIGRDASSLVAPPCMAEAQRALEQAVERYTGAATRAITGIRTNNPLLVSGTSLLGQRDGDLQIAEVKRLLGAAQC